MARTTRRRLPSETGIFGVLIVVIVALCLLSPNFRTIDNGLVLLLNGSVIAFLALGQTFVLLTGGIDLSAGANVAMTGVLAALMMKAGLPWMVAALGAICVGMILGLINGALVHYVKVPAFIATFSTQGVAIAIPLIVTGANSVAVRDSGFSWIGQGKIAGIPMPVIMFIVVAIIAGLFLSWTRPGVHVYALGGNAAAARLAGVNTARTTLMVYAFSGICGGIGGIIATSRLMVGFPATGLGNELFYSIAAAVVGGGIALWRSRVHFRSDDRCHSHCRSIQWNERPQRPKLLAITSYRPDHLGRCLIRYLPTRSCDKDRPRDHEEGKTDARTPTNTRTPRLSVGIERLTERTQICIDAERAQLLVSIRTEHSFLKNHKSSIHFTETAITMKRSRSFVIATAAVLLLSLGACTNESTGGNGSSGSTGSEGSKELPASCKDDKPLIGVALPNTVNPYYVAMKESFEKNGADAGFDVKVAVANDSDSDQLSQVESFIQQGACAVALNAVNSGPGAASVAALNRAGIPVFTVNVIVSEEDLETQNASFVQYVGADQAAGGKAMGEQVAKDFGADAKIVVGIVGNPDQIPTNQRDEGFKKALERNKNVEYPALVNGKIDPNVSLQVTTDMLQGNPEITVIFADAGPHAVGALQAVQQLGRGDTVKIYAFCAADQGITDVYKACAAQEPADYARIVVENMKTFLGGTKVEHDVLQPLKVFTEGTPAPGEVG